MTITHPDIATAEHAEKSVEHLRGMAETYRTYLTWATDEDLRRWAAGMASAYDLAAMTEAAYAEAIRQRVAA